MLPSDGCRGFLLSDAEPIQLRYAKTSRSWVAIVHCPPLMAHVLRLHPVALTGATLAVAGVGT